MSIDNRWIYFLSSKVCMIPDDRWMMDRQGHRAHRTSWHSCSFKQIKLHVSSQNLKTGVKTFRTPKPLAKAAAPWLWKWFQLIFSSFNPMFSAIAVPRTSPKKKYMKPNSLRVKRISCFAKQEAWVSLGISLQLSVLPPGRQLKLQHIIFFYTSFTINTRQKLPDNKVYVFSDHGLQM